MHSQDLFLISEKSMKERRKMYLNGQQGEIAIVNITGDFKDGVNKVVSRINVLLNNNS